MVKYHKTLTEHPWKEETAIVYQIPRQIVVCIEWVEVRMVCSSIVLLYYCIV